MSFGEPPLHVPYSPPRLSGHGGRGVLHVPRMARACGGLGRPWLWSRACLGLWPSYLISPLRPAWWGCVVVVVFGLLLAFSS